MAPSYRKDHIDAADVKEDFFSSVQFSSQVSLSFVSLKSVERDYGLSLQVCLVANFFVGQRLDVLATQLFHVEMKLEQNIPKKDKTGKLCTCTQMVLTPSIFLKL